MNDTNTGTNATANRTGSIYRTISACLVATTTISLFIAGCGNSSGNRSNISAASTNPPAQSVASSVPPNTTVAYITLPLAGEVIPINLNSLQIGSPIQVQPFPDPIAASPDGKLLLVGSFPNYSGGHLDSITPISAANHSPGKPITLPGNHPSGIVFTPNGKTALVAMWGGSTLVPVDIKTLKAGKPIPVHGPTGDLGVTPDGKLALVSNFGSDIGWSSGPIGDTVTPVNLITHKAGRPIVVGPNPCDIAINHSGTTAYVTISGGNEVVPINLKTFKTQKPYIVGSGPEGIAMSQDGSTLWVTVKGSPILSSNQNLGSLVSINLASGAITTILSNLNDAWSVIPIPSKNALLITNAQSYTAEIVSLSQAGSYTIIPLPSRPHAAALAIG